MKNTFILSFIVAFFLCTTGSAQKSKTAGKGKTFLKNKALVHPAESKGTGFISQSITVPYGFSYHSSSYANLAGATSLNGGFTWDDPSYTIPLGFNFILWSDTITTLDFIDLGGSLGPGLAGIQPFVSYWSDLCDRACTPGNWEGDPGSLSNISYLTSGTPGNRICKIEWNNSGFYEDISDNGTSTDNVNFQLWLYEGSNDIEFHFGPNSIVQNALVHDGLPGPVISVGLYDFNMDTILFYCAQGNPASPTATTASFDFSTDTLSVSVAGNPANGIVYKFSWSFLSGVNDLGTQNRLIDIYPNPVSEVLTLLWNGSVIPEDAQIEVADMLGRTVRLSPASFDGQGKLRIDLGHLNSGSYVLKVRTAGRTIYKKLVKQ